ncbi:MAG: signal peptidase I [Pseudomonadota bacterium]
MTSRPSTRGHSTKRSAKINRREGVGSLLRFVLVVAAIAWAFRSLVGAPFNIPSGSMLPTLYIGDYVAVAKWPYGYSRYSFPLGLPTFEGRILGRLPSRGDVVVFRHPAENADLIKRVIALPGDTVEVRRGRLVLNGREVPRRPLPPVRVPVTANSPCRAVPPAVPTVIVTSGTAACIYRAYLETLPGGPSYTVLDQVDGGPADDFGPVRVPSDHVFVMGDNRDDSLDSRFPTIEGGVGMLPVENLIGRASFTFWSTDGRVSWFKPWTWFGALRASRIGNGYTGVAE